MHYFLGDSLRLPQTIVYNAYDEKLTGRFKGEIETEISSSLTIDGKRGIRLEIEDINLLAYKIEVNGVQQDMVNRENLHNVSTNFLLSNTLFDINKLNIPQLPSIAISGSENFPNVDTTVAKIHELRENLNLKEIELSKAKQEFRNIEAFFNPRLEYLNDKKYKTDYEIRHLNLKKKSSGDPNEKDEEYLRLKKELEGIVKDIEDFKQKKNTAFENKFELEQVVDQLNYNIQKLEDDIFNIKKNSDEEAAELERMVESYETLRMSLRSLGEVRYFYNNLICLLYTPNVPFKDLNSDKEKLSRSFLGEMLTIGTTTSFQEEISSSDIMPQISPAEILEECNQRIKRVEESYTSLNKLFLQYITNSNKSNNANKGIKISEKELPDNRNILENTLNELEFIPGQINLGVYQPFFNQLISIYKAFNRHNFHFVVPLYIVSEKTDKITISIVAKPISNIPCTMGQKPMKVEFEAKIDGGFKIDASTGMFFNFGVNDRSYRFGTKTMTEVVDGKPVENEVSTVIEDEKNNGVFLPGIGVLLHGYRRGPKPVKPAIAIGVSTSDAKSLTYYLGGSLLLGFGERIVFTGGFVGKQVSVAAPGFEPSNDLVITNPGDFDSVPLKNPSPYRIGGFFAITFNLSGSNQQNGALLIGEK